MNQQHHYINMEYINAMAGDDTAFACEIISDYLQKIPVLLEKIAEAGNKRDDKEVLFLSHKLRSSFEFLGIRTLGDITFRIENDCKKGIFNDEINPMIAEIREAFEFVKTELEDELKKY